MNRWISITMFLGDVSLGIKLTVQSVTVIGKLELISQG